MTRYTRFILAAISLLIPALALLVPGASAAGTANAAGPDYTRIDRYLSSQIGSAHIPGAALGIVHGKQIVHLYGTGDVDSSGRTVTPQTPFILGSVSKSFTALAVMQLVQAHRVQLDAPVRRYLPAFRLADGGAYTRITVRQLLTHTSGIPKSAGTDPLRGPQATLAAQVHALASVRSGTPGAHYEYSNANYEVLGLVVQTVSGEPFGTYIQQHIFAPLDMRHSYVTEVAAQRAGLTQGHILYFGYPMARRAFYRADFLPAGFLASTATDMTHYLTAQMNGGRYEHASVLSPAGIAALHRPEVDAGGPLKSRYGMGWITSVVGGRSLLWHDGSSYDMHTFMAIDPNTRWGVIVLFNGSSPLYELLSTEDAIGWTVMGMADGFPGQGTLEGLYIGFDAMVLLTTLLTLRTLVTLLRGQTPSPPRWSFLAAFLTRRTPERLKWVWRVYSCAVVPVVVLIELPRLLDAPWPALVKTDIGLWLLVIVGLRLLIGAAWLARAVRARSRATPEPSESRASVPV
jgi:CubicO group peptidase (beta-lactamase class C family)